MHAVGEAKGKKRNKAKGQGKDVKGTGKSSGKSKNWQEEPEHFLYKCHNCGEKGHKA